MRVQNPQVTSLQWQQFVYYSLDEAPNEIVYQRARNVVKISINEAS
jgi:hypothetical protein